MPIINTPDGLKRIMYSDLKKVIYSVSLIAKDIVVENVWNIVYDPYHPRVYERQGWMGGFIGSWEIKDENFKGTTSDAIVYRIFSNPATMQYIAEGAIHGSPDGETDRRDIMARIIAEGTNYDFVSSISSEERATYGIESDWWTEPRDYFTPSLEKISDELDFMVQDAYEEFNAIALPSEFFD